MGLSATLSANKEHGVNIDAPEKQPMETMELAGRCRLRRGRVLPQSTQWGPTCHFHRGGKKKKKDHAKGEEAVVDPQARAEPKESRHSRLGGRWREPKLPYILGRKGVPDVSAGGCLRECRPWGKNSGAGSPHWGLAPFRPPKKGPRLGF